MRIGIALGSNLGERFERLGRAKESLLDLHRGEAPALVSPLYETLPVDCEPGTEPFLNAVIEIGTALDPNALLDFTQRLESEAGRPARRAKNSPRPLDLDLLYGIAASGESIRVGGDRLEIPHPRLVERRFVLVPLARIRPDLVLPNAEGTIASTLRQLDSDEAEPVLFRERW